ncbi:MAG: prepilin peptidase [Anaerolineae bacterium]|jgi:hypothetical protein|nr:prepilin peptidase [Anaerolineae bacterium]
MPFYFIFPPYFCYLACLFIPAAHISIFILMVFAAVQDYKTGEVSNWITIPLFIGGVVILLAHQNLLLIIVSFVLLFLWHKGWVGGADVKVLIGLFGVWSEAALVAFFVLGAWGIMFIIRKKQKSFPGLIPIAVGVGLTFIRELSIILFELRCIPQTGCAFFYFN